MEKHYLDEIPNGVRTLKKYQSEIDSVYKTRSNRREVLAVVFPELLRYNVFRDVLESTSNRIGYLQYGSRRWDFSVGMFQMKPSFVEDLEWYIDRHSELEEFDFISIEARGKRGRRERLRRINDPCWQLLYAYGYYRAAEMRFGHLPFKDKYDRLSFYATAYNYGFLKPIEEILDWRQKARFPYGKNYRNRQYAYGDFSVMFYKNYSDEF